MIVEEYIKHASELGASDVHVVAGLPPKCRKDGQLIDLFPEILTHDTCEKIASELAGKLYSKNRGYRRAGFGQNHCRRANQNQSFFRQQGSISAALRILSNQIPKLEQLGLPPVVSDFPSYRKGIILVTGETGSGKSTTLAAILNQINHTRTDHIITLEDPIEYLYDPDKCIINQREIGKDTESYDDGLRAILREDPM